MAKLMLEESKDLQKEFKKRGVNINTSDCGRIVLYARKHCHMQVSKCNGEFNSFDQTREAALRFAIRKAIKKYDLGAEFMEDPRGFTVKLYKEGTSIRNAYGVGLEK